MSNENSNNKYDLYILNDNNEYQMLGRVEQCNLSYMEEDFDMSNFFLGNDSIDFTSPIMINAIDKLKEAIGMCKVIDLYINNTKFRGNITYKTKTKWKKKGRRFVRNICNWENIILFFDGKMVKDNVSNSN